MRRDLGVCWRFFQEGQVKSAKAHVINMVYFPEVSRKARAECLSGGAPIIAAASSGGCQAVNRLPVMG